MPCTYLRIGRCAVRRRTVGAEEYCRSSIANTLARMATVSIGRAAVAVRIICGRLGSARASYIYECGVPVDFDLSALRMHFPVRK